MSIGAPFAPPGSKAYLTGRGESFKKQPPNRALAMIRRRFSRSGPLRPFDRFNVDHNLNDVGVMLDDVPA
jgi:hypothetical protein